MRVLLSAFSCASGWGSEPGVTWGFIQKATTRHEVLVLINAHNRPLIETKLARSPFPEAYFVYLGPLVFKKLTYRSPWSHYPYYAAWQVEALRMVKRLHREVGFDVVHHLTCMNPWVPSLLGWVPPRFIWTAGNVERTPWGFIQEMSWRGQLEEIFRNPVLSLGFSVAGPFATRRGALILSASLPERWGMGLPVQHFPLGGLTVDEPGAELHRDAVQRAGAFFWASPRGEQALSILFDPSKHRPADAQPGVLLRAAQDRGSRVVS